LSSVIKESKKLTFAMAGNPKFAWNFALHLHHNAATAARE
jgi:hypothetical protein